MDFSVVLQETFVSSLTSLWGGLLQTLPKIIVALFVFFAGWLFAVLIGKVVRKFVASIKLDSLLRSAGLDDVLEKTGFSLNSGLFFGELFKWFFIVFFLKLSLDIVNLQQINDFLTDVLLYLPRVVVASVILFAGVLIANGVKGAISRSLVGADEGMSKIVGGFAKLLVWIFVIVAALSQLGIAPDVLNAIIIGVVGMLALAGGLAFGLGGREHAKRFLDYVERQMFRK